MSELPPDEQAAADDVAVPLPRWVSVLIGVVLVAIASLAVITGIRYRDRPMGQMVKSRSTAPRAVTSAPPGEPEAGASLVSAGIPQAGETVTGVSRAEVTGGAGGVQAVVRMWARRGLRIHATPSDAVVFVNNVAVGQASQFDSENEVYDFAETGSYTIRLSAPGYKDRQYVVTAQENAAVEVARIDVKLERE